MRHAMIQKGCTLRAEPGIGRTLKFIISTGDEDRMNDTIDPTGWDLEAWKANPIILFGHNHDLPAIARGIAIGVERGMLRSTAEFPPEGMHPLADTVYNLAKSGFLTSASVGFIPLKWSFNDRGGRDFEQQRLMEWSVVNIPALPQAQLEASMGAASSIAKWLGNAGGLDDPVLDLDLDDEPLPHRADVIAASRTLIPGLVRAARQRDEEIDIEGIDMEDDDIELTPAAVREALLTVIPSLLRAEANRLRGRVD